ncbi:phosphocholine-specific phospholipase C, partial [Roseateles sp.]|uniref:phosphocholine-specific phospholipase C n=1 Tax=Roseateles sp. TaxID=1971397 RepID=UPI002E006A45
MSHRRQFLAQAGAAGLLGIIQRAQAVAPARVTGTIKDVAHVVVLMQENRSFDHYFGSLPGVRGFADPFPLPTPGGGTVWTQPRAQGGAPLRPFRLDTRAHPELMRLHGTPHTWPDAQLAWDHGRMSRWPAYKHDHALAHYGLEDIAFHVALAEAFTVCDAYHCSFQGGTHPNRYYLNTGTVDPQGQGGGPALFNDLEGFGPADGSGPTYRWTTYAERLQAAGVPWQVYQVLDDNFDDNSLASFQVFRDAHFQRPGHDPQLRERGVADAGLDRLRADVLAGRLPAVSWVIGTAEGSEHPATSSPAQGASYIAKVLDALTADPEVWARTVLFINYDENDGWFDHVPPPAVPSRDGTGGLAGASGVPTDGEYQERLSARHQTAQDRALLGRPLGLGPRVPMFVVSPWSRGGWVCSEVLDHTSVLRFLEARFGVAEPHITPWRRAVCGDLTAAFD